EYHGELGLLLGGGGAGPARRGRGDRDGGGGGGDAELLFHVLDELRELKDGHAPDRVENVLLGDCHDLIAPGLRIVERVAGGGPMRPASPSGRGQRRPCARTSTALR